MDELVLQISRHSISVINTGIIISYRQTGNIRYQVKLIHRGKSFIRDYKFICIEGQKRMETSREESDVCTNKEELERN